MEPKSLPYRWYVGSISVNPRLSVKIFPQFLLNFKNSNPESHCPVTCIIPSFTETGSQLSTSGRTQVLFSNQTFVQWVSLTLFCLCACTGWGPPKPDNHQTRTAPKMLNLVFSLFSGCPSLFLSTISACLF
jgi:hypothetical protein